MGAQPQNHLAQFSKTTSKVRGLIDNFDSRADTAVFPPSLGFVPSNGRRTPEDPTEPSILSLTNVVKHPEPKTRRKGPVRFDGGRVTEGGSSGLLYAYSPPSSSSTLGFDAHGNEESVSDEDSCMVSAGRGHRPCLGRESEVATNGRQANSTPVHGLVARGEPQVEESRSCIPGDRGFDGAEDPSLYLSSHGIDPRWDLRQDERSRCVYVQETYPNQGNLPHDHRHSDQAATGRDRKGPQSSLPGIAGAGGRERKEFYYAPPPGYDLSPPSSFFHGGPHPPMRAKNGLGTEREARSEKGRWIPRYMDPPKDWRPDSDGDVQVLHDEGRWRRKGIWRPLPDVPGGWAWIPNHLGGEDDCARSKSEWEGGSGPTMMALKGIDYLLPNLHHKDWTVPQSKQILTAWATLATLLAGTQTTLLTVFLPAKAGKATLAFAFSALAFEIYGAVLAAFTIMASIAIQAQAASRDGEVEAASVQLEALNDNEYDLDNTAMNHSGISRRSVSILDKLTVSCGYIVPLGGMLELAGLMIFVSFSHPGCVSGILAGTVGLCLASTVISVLWGIAHEQRDKLCRREG
ncbi:hypothetical protein IE53DRAFT_385729 [Violaceomyces palustris]|uniref:Uncharacterized protein n=1 Tax=Violaceomyces palustris TaxID=1673888 RepID=A0ACD0P1K7_9BASI|nr:hypothetical protein IE53DRAFT_385729 [Violaceomyces palustris]